MTTGRRDGRWDGWGRWVSWRVTRYDPARRDWRGAYPFDEWTCSFDIGGAFRDGTLTPGRYLACEDACVAVVGEAVRESGVSGLRVADHLAARPNPLPPPDGVLCHQLPGISLPMGYGVRAGEVAHSSMALRAVPR